MTSPSAYMPMDRRQALFQGQSLAEHAEGACLFVDVSGFTPLTASLVRRFGRRRGVEELTSRLNRLWSTLIAGIHARRGSVIGFSGDAITCWFENDDGFAATTCAFSLQEAIQDLSVQDGTAMGFQTLSIKAAVAAGRVRRMLVGEPERHCLEVIAGPPLIRMATAESKAQAGEVVVAPEVVPALGDFTGEADSEGYRIISRLARWSEPRPWRALDPAAIPDSAARPFLLPEVFERLTGGQGELLAELRPACPLFVRFTGLDFDDHRAQGRLDTFVRLVQEILARYEGSLIDITTGDKGSYLYASFGAPIAHEDDTERAVAAAESLRQGVLGLDFSLSLAIGISQGSMYSGAYGGPARRTYGVLGEETNRAARLMQQAKPGQILVSGRIASRIRARRELVDLGEIRVKGQAEPIPIFEVPTGGGKAGEARAEVSSPNGRQEKGRQPRRASNLVGRREERQAIGRELDRLLAGGQGRLVWIEGEAGIGKSSLLEDFAQRASSLSLTPLWGQADAVESSTPYFAWRPILSRLLGLEPDQGPAENLEAARHAIARLRSPRLIALAPLLAPILGLDLTDSDLTAQMSAQARAENTRDLLVGLLQEAAATVPLILVLEDTHWLDSASWALTSLVQREVSPLLLILATRPAVGTTSQERELLRARSGNVLLELGALEPAYALELVCRRLGVDRLPPQVAELIAEKAEGNPFFSEELAYALRDSGWIELEDGRCRLRRDGSDLTEMDFPDTIEGVMVSRMDRLSPAHQSILKVASVIGRTFSLSALEEIYPLPEDRPRLRQSLDDLSALGLTPLETLEPEPSYTFKHIITQEVAYNRMLFAQRRRLHLAVGEWLERAHDEDLQSSYPLLAHHWHRATEVVAAAEPSHVARAIGYLELAGEQALGQFANREAVQLFGRALGLDGDLRRRPGTSEHVAKMRRRARWHAQLGVAHLKLEELPASRTHLMDALRLLGFRQPHGQWARITGLLGQVCRQATHRLLPIRSKAGKEETESLLEAARLYHGLTEICFLGMEVLPFAHAATSALNLAEKAGRPSPELADASGAMCLMTALSPLRPLASGYERRADRTAEQLPNLYTRARALLLTGCYHLALGRFADALSRLEKAREVYEGLGDHHHWAECAAVLATANLLAGDPARATALAESLVLDGRRRSSPLELTWGLELASIPELMKGNPRRAAELLEEALALLAKNMDRHSEIYATGLLAVARLRLGELSPARRHADAAMGLIARHPLPTMTATLWGYTGVAEVYLQLLTSARRGGEPTGELRRLARQACRNLHRMRRAQPVTEPYAWLYQARFEQLQGKKKRALELGRRCLESGRALKMPYETALAHLDLGSWSPTAQGEAEEHLQRAERLLIRMGLPGSEGHEGTPLEVEPRQEKNWDF